MKKTDTKPIDLNTDNIFENLKGMRNAGPEYSAESSQLLNSILKVEVEWKVEHQQVFMETILREYLKYDIVKLEELLAVCGITEEYKNFTEENTGKGGPVRAVDRRKEYAKNHKLRDNERSLNTQENQTLKKIAKSMADDYRSGKLEKLIISAFATEDLLELGFVEFVTIQKWEQYHNEKSERGRADAEPPIVSLPRNAVEDFVSRVDVLWELDKIFKDKDERRLAILSGMGGAGKTQIALKYAYTVRNEYDAVFWLDATKKESLEERAEEILKEYVVEKETNESLSTEEKEVSDPLPTDIRFKQFINGMNGKRILLVYDNADYLDEDDDTAEALKQTLSSYMPEGVCHVLMTTRCGVEFNNGTLVHVDVFSPEVAEQYLMRAAKLEASEALSTLAKRMGYLPLSLRYAGAYIRTQKETCEEYLKYWDESGLELFDDKRYAEITVRKTFDITLDKLDPDRKSLWFTLLALAVNMGGEYFAPKIYAQLENVWQFTGMKLAISWMASDKEHANMDEFVDMLTHPLKLNRAIKLLVDYSLIDWDGTGMYIHPMLREVISDEFNNGMEHLTRAKAFWPNYKKLMEMYKLAGDKKLEQKYGQLYAHECLRMLVTFYHGEKIIAEKQGRKPCYKSYHHAMKSGAYEKTIMTWGTEEDKKAFTEMSKQIAAEEESGDAVLQYEDAASIFMGKIDWASAINDYSSKERKP